MEIRPCLLLRGIDSESNQQFQELKSLGLPILLEKSVGNKHALQVAFELCGKMGWTHLLSLDGSDLEAIAKIPEMLGTIPNHPWSLIVLSENLSASAKQNHFIKRALLGSANYDALKNTNCCYPVFLVQMLKINKLNPLPHLKVLAHLMWNNVEAVQIPYLPKKKNNSPNLSEKLYDSYYTTLLSAIANVRLDSKPKNAAISCGVGAFIACTPFYGLQTLLIFITCFIFRLNFPIAFIGSQVSLPPIYSLVLPAELFIGFKVLNKPFVTSDNWLQTAQDHFFAWSVGALIVGGFLGLCLGSFWYFMQRKAQQTNKVNWSGSMRGGKWGNLFLVFILKTLGQRAGYFLLYFIVPYFYLFAPKARRGLNEYWLVIRPEMSWLPRQIQILKQFMIFAKILMDRAIQAYKSELFFEINRSRSIDFKKVAEDPQPLLVLLSHTGGWGISIQGFSKKALTSPISIIEYESQALSAESILQNKKTSAVQRISIKPGEPLFMKLHDLFKEGGNLGLMGDRPFDQNFELRTFFGKLIALPTTPFRLAKIYNCNLTFLLGFKTGLKNYELIAESIDVSQKEVHEMEEQYLRFLETHLKEKPLQWFNFYNFWSSVPTLPNGQACYPRKYNLAPESVWTEGKSENQLSY